MCVFCAYIATGFKEITSDKFVKVKLEIEPEKTLVDLGVQRRVASIVAEGSLKIETHKCTFPGCDSKGIYICETRISTVYSSFLDVRTNMILITE